MKRPKDPSHGSQEHVPSRGQVVSDVICRDTWPLDIYVERLLAADETLDVAFLQVWRWARHLNISVECYTCGIVEVSTLTFSGTQAMVRTMTSSVPLRS